jgi:hypothetical protein
MQFELVTYGYVPWSMSSSAPCAPSNSSESPRARGVDQLGDVGDHRHDGRGHREQLVAHRREGQRFGLVVVHEHEVVQLEQAFEAGGEAIGVGEVLHAQRAPSDLVLVGRADAAAGRADLDVAERALARLVERDVHGQHERARGRDAQPIAHADAGRFQLADLLQQRRERQHDAVADQDRHALVQHARRYEAQYRLAPAGDERMTGILPTLEAHDALRAFRQPVDDLAFALVAPLCADDDDVLRLGVGADFCCHRFTPADVKSRFRPQRAPAGLPAAANRA